MQNQKFFINVGLSILAGAIAWILPEALAKPDYFERFFAPNILPYHLLMIIFHTAMVGGLQYCIGSLLDNLHSSEMTASLASIGIFFILALPPIGSGIFYFLSMGMGTFWVSPSMTSGILLVLSILLLMANRALSK